MVATLLLSRSRANGDTVNVVIDPSYQKGQPHHRFHGLTGKVTGNQGKAYVVSTRVGKMLKELIVNLQFYKILMYFYFYVIEPSTKTYEKSEKNDKYSMRIVEFFTSPYQ